MQSGNGSGGSDYKTQTYLTRGSFNTTSGGSSPTFTYSDNLTTNSVSMMASDISTLTASV